MQMTTKVPREARWSVFYIIATFAVLAALVAPPQAHAFDSYMTAFNARYTAGVLEGNCGVCHDNVSGNQGGRNNNLYGQAYEGTSGTADQRLAALEGQTNSDTDNTPTLDEFKAGFLPGRDCHTYPDAGGSLANFEDLVDPENIGCGTGNVPPTADANGPYNGTAGQPVTFDGSASNDPDGTISAYDWDFGDGNTGTGVSPTNTYAAAGS